MSGGRHRPPRWWARSPVATAVAAGVLVVVLVIAFAAAVGPRPQVDQAQPITPAPTQPHTTGTKPWPTVTIPTIGAPGAYNPDAPTSTTAPEPPHCSRCGERTPAETTPATAPETPPAPAANQTPAEPVPGPPPPADPQPAVELIALVNADRLANGCGPVTLDPSLVEQSQRQAERQAADDTMYHSAGVTGFDTWGENVAYGYDTAAAVHDAWMSSPPHRSNILTCSFRYMGAAAADSFTGARYWTEQFAV